MNRAALAHLPWGDTSLCGDTTTIGACPECVRRLLSLLLVHVQSLRRPRKSFCGRVIVHHPDAPTVTDGAGVSSPRLFWVTPDQAREMIRARRSTTSPATQSWEGWPVVPRICQACETNLIRFDEAHLRARAMVSPVLEGRQVSGPGELGAPSPPPPPASRRNGVGRGTNGGAP